MLKQSVVLDRLHLRPLQMCLLSVWRPHILPLDHQIPIISMILFHIKWWMDTDRFAQGKFIHPPDPNTFFFYGCQPLCMGSSVLKLSVVLDRLHLRPLQMCLLSVWRPHILPLDHQSSDFISNGGWTPITSLRENSSILQIPIHSFLRMPAIMDGELISN